MIEYIKSKLFRRFPWRVVRKTRYDQEWGDVWEWRETLRVWGEDSDFPDMATAMAEEVRELLAADFDDQCQQLKAS
jgi:hypothetical protein